MKTNKLLGLIIITLLSCSTKDKLEESEPNKFPNIDYKIKIIEDQFNGTDIILAGSGIKILSSLFTHFPNQENFFVLKE